MKTAEGNMYNDPNIKQKSSHNVHTMHEGEQGPDQGRVPAEVHVCGGQPAHAL